MGLLRMAARTAVVAGTATAVSSRVAYRQADKHAEKQAEQQQAAQAQQQPAEPAPAEAAPAQDDSMEKLQQLADLHAKGVLSDEEFAAAKAKVLGI
jgi:membrane protease subunit (stomatin/prohibitin family)